eukprot:7365049-Pyramimonas_sp.AAC.1
MSASVALWVLLLLLAAIAVHRVPLRSAPHLCVDVRYRCGPPPSRALANIARRPRARPFAQRSFDMAAHVGEDEACETV